MSTTVDNTLEIKAYWDQRAFNAAESPKATTDDIYLRELEIKTFTQAIRGLDLADGSVVVDIGCGDGFTTCHIAAQFPQLKFIGVDYSQAMITTARMRLSNIPKLADQYLEFRVGDATSIETLFASNSVDVVLTDRCLINLASPLAQYDAIRQIYKILRAKGYYLGIENFTSGQEELNKARTAIGLMEIPVRWHNLFFKEDEFRDTLQSLYSDINIINFSSAYYYATRVIYSKYCQMLDIEPDYCHELHQLAVNLPIMGMFSPIKLAVLAK
jgi:ubiquinone/menaquinone biosynthesis C-methylase UbiE